MFFDKVLIIVRHGNTFREGEVSFRVGARTDLRLVEEYRSLAAARVIGAYNFVPTQVFAAPLLRTRQTAELIVRGLGLGVPILDAAEFTEVDYGVDEGRTEEEVMKRLGTFYLGEGADLDAVMCRGREEIERWNVEGVVPVGWRVDVGKIISDWRRFAGGIANGETVVVVSSNGIIRFAPYILDVDDCENFCKNHNLKITTAGVCIFVQKNNKWKITHWNIKPPIEKLLPEQQFNP
ncbi:MAG: histidine phosphatase family protein [Planctomycetaceae bacterium]|jgi:probable phosphoglycerate mutase|nr:histidine phosphatase family protein [Planctomycetaceae bacterium]